MKRILFLFTALFLISINGIAGNLDKAFERLNLLDYFNARELFEKSMKKDPAAAAYGLSRIHSSADNPFYNLDTARHFILMSDSVFSLLKEKQKSEYAELGISQESIIVLKESICSKAMKAAEGSKSVDQLNHYLSKFSYCGSKEAITILRNSIAYQEAKTSHTAISYKNFLEKYPDAIEYKDALNRFQERVFEEETASQQLGAYERFIAVHPESPYKMQAERMIYQISTSQGSIAEHKAFIQRYPDNRYVKESWREIYNISMKDYDEQTYLRFKFDFPEYPYMDELESDYKLQTSLLLPFKRAQYWGFINELGEEVIPPIYEEVNYFSEGLSLVSKEGKFGYISKSGKLVIPFMWDDAESFKNNCAVVSKGEKFGLVSRNGDFLIPAEYDELTEPVEDISVVMQNGKSGYIEKTGRALTKVEFDMAEDFHEGFAIIGFDELFGLINSKGVLVVDAKYQHLQWVSDDLLKAELNEMWGLINRVGEVVLPFEYDAIGEFHNKRALIAKNEKCGFINSAAQIVIPLNYRYSENLLGTAIFQNGYVLLSVKGKNTILDTMGVRIQFPGYENTGIPSEGLIPVQKLRKWGFVDYNGRLKVPCNYQGVSPFKNNLSIVKSESFTGILDTAGRWFAAPAYHDVIRSGSFFIPQLHGLNGLLSDKGVLLAPCEFDRIEILFDQIAMLQKEDTRTYISLKSGTVIWGSID